MTYFVLQFLCYQNPTILMEWFVITRLHGFLLTLKNINETLEISLKTILNFEVCYINIFKFYGLYTNFDEE